MLVANCTGTASWFANALGGIGFGDVASTGSTSTANTPGAMAGGLRNLRGMVRSEHEKQKT
jgi:hypothetical protein